MRCAASAVLALTLAGCAQSGGGASTGAGGAIDPNLVVERPGNAAPRAAEDAVLATAPASTAPASTAPAVASSVPVGVPAASAPPASAPASIEALAASARPPGAALAPGPATPRRGPPLLEAATSMTGVGEGVSSAEQAIVASAARPRSRPVERSAPSGMTTASLNRPGTGSTPAPSGMATASLNRPGTGSTPAVEAMPLPPNDAGAAPRPLVGGSPSPLPQPTMASTGDPAAGMAPLPPSPGRRVEQNGVTYVTMAPGVLVASLDAVLGASFAAGQPLPVPDAAPRPVDALDSALLATLEAEAATPTAPPSRAARPPVPRPPAAAAASPGGDSSVSFLAASIIFAARSSAVSEKDRDRIADIINMATDTAGRVRVIGYASLEVAPAAAAKLARARAQSVAAALQRAGLNPQRIAIGAVTDEADPPALALGDPEAAGRRADIFIDY